MNQKLKKSNLNYHFEAKIISNFFILFKYILIFRLLQYLYAKKKTIMEKHPNGYNKRFFNLQFTNANS